jgi:hypothetical protein
VEYVKTAFSSLALQSMGLEKLVSTKGDKRGAIEAVERANAALGF